MENSLMTPSPTIHSLPHRPISQIALRVRAAAPTIEVGRDARAYCPRHGARLIAGQCPFCRPPATSTFEVAA
jgi:hypothetical protein